MLQGGKEGGGGHLVQVIGHKRRKRGTRRRGKKREKRKEKNSPPLNVFRRRGGEGGVGERKRKKGKGDHAEEVAPQADNWARGKEKSRKPAMEREGRGEKGPSIPWHIKKKRGEIPWGEKGGKRRRSCSNSTISER